MPRYFSQIATWPARAAQIWQILVSEAYNRQTAAYGEIAEILKYEGAGTLAQILGHIYNYCNQNNLPPLTVLVVNQNTGLPGIEVAEDMNVAREAVYKFDWFDVVPPTFKELEAAFKEGS
jgi:putative restriction endonuclease